MCTSRQPLFLSRRTACRQGVFRDEQLEERNLAAVELPGALPGEVSQTSRRYHPPRPVSVLASNVDGLKRLRTAGAGWRRRCRTVSLSETCVPEKSGKLRPKAKNCQSIGHNRLLQARGMGITPGLTRDAVLMNSSRHTERYHLAATTRWRRVLDPAN